ncbi:MAG TPA: hypothetical protein VGF24_24115 [Vicinamibacterales bacterium]|jgi:hypothetical protein
MRRKTSTTRSQKEAETRRGPISIGDGIRAILDLQPRDEETADAIRTLLGIDREPITLSLPNVGPWKPSTQDAVAPGGAQPPVTTGSPSIAESPKPQPQGTPMTGIDIRLTKRGSGPPPPPVWASVKSDVLPVTTRGKAPPPAPLFGPPRGRAILSTTLATVVNEGDIDLDRVVDGLAGGQVLTSLPRLPTLTLRRGVELLIDRGSGIDPFRADIQWLVQSVDDILSDDRLDVASFAGCPSRGVGSGPRQKWTPWVSKRPGTPVVVVTDLGIGGLATDRDRASLVEWLRFAHGVRESGCDLIALVPYEAGRWPPMLSRVMTIIHWSERTSVGSVRRARHEAHARFQ